MTHPYLIPEYPDMFRCSECGVKYTYDEYWKYYRLDKILQYHINCKKCGAVFSEEPKRCYFEEVFPGYTNGCSDCTTINGVKVCTRQTTHRKKELQSWGCYYSCEAMKPPMKEPEWEQLTLF